MNYPIPVTGKAWQRQIREQEAALDPLLAEKQALAVDLKNATVREIDYQTAKEFIALRVVEVNGDDRREFRALLR
jgi:hypothetical protein